MPPSLRIGKRYIIFEVISENHVEYGELANAIWTSMLNFLGELETSESRIWIIKNLYDAKNQKGVIRCKHDRVEYVRAALTLIQMIGEVKAIIRILGVTGTIKSAKNKYLGFRNLRDFSPS